MYLSASLRTLTILYPGRYDCGFAGERTEACTQTVIRATTAVYDHCPGEPRTPVSHPMALAWLVALWDWRPEIAILLRALVSMLQASRFTRTFLRPGRDVVFPKDTRIEIETTPLRAPVLKAGS